MCPRTRFLTVFASAILFFGSSVLPGMQQPPTAPAADGLTVACRALEVHRDEDLKVTVVVFHQRDQNDRSQLAALLRAHSGQIAQFQAAGEAGHRARVFRLKNCFGRGLLLVTGTAPPGERAEFILRFSPD